MPGTDTTSTPVPVRDSPDTYQLTRDQSSEQWDDLANVIFPYNYPLGPGPFTIPPNGSLVYPVSFPMPVVGMAEAWCRVYVEMDLTTDGQDVLLQGDYYYRGDTPPTSGDEIAHIVLPPLGGTYGQTLNGFRVNDIRPGMIDFYLIVKVGAGAPSVDVWIPQIAIRRGTIKNVLGQSR